MAADRHDDEDQRGASDTAEEAVDESWSTVRASEFVERLFPYEEPYANQREGIEMIREIGADSGFAVVEGACGTGKTLMAVLAGLALVRDPGTQYERVLCLTSVKQQLRAFEDDVQAINANLPTTPDDRPLVEPVSGLTLVGKQDLCAYEAAGVELPGSGGFYDSCDTLRDTVTNHLHGADGREKFARVERLLDSARAREHGPGAEYVDMTAGEADPLETASWTAPHADHIPAVPETDPPQPFCPFYAQAVREFMQEESSNYEGADVGFHLRGMLTPAGIRKRGAQAGLCPHIAMRESLEQAEILVGNYYHAFDPVTITRLTGDLLGPETFLVCDEAHTLVANVRDLLSDELALTTIIEAIGEILPAEGQRDEHDLSSDLRAAINNPDVPTNISVDEVQALGRFLRDFRRFLEDEAVQFLADDHPEWKDDPDSVAPDDAPEKDDRTVETPLGAPDRAKTDRVQMWLKREGYESDLLEYLDCAEEVAEVLRTIRDVTGAFGSKDPSIASVARVLERWHDTDNTQYFRTLALTRRQAPHNADLAWREEFTASLQLHNCIPAEAIASRLASFGGGVLMSATLAPLAEYRREVGIEALRREEDRPVAEAVFGLTFPPENRASLAVKLPKFTYSNREDYDPDDPSATARFNDVRAAYADALVDGVTTTPGNVLIAVPSYAEAQWVKQALDEADVDREVLVDESSSDAATEALKADFFAGGPKALVTSLRGTLTEGVDYEGDRLAGVIVVGVPIRPTNGDFPEAIKTAYQDAFGSDGWDLAFGVPAVRKARQAIGRVIRGPDEVGVRLYLDERYTGTAGWSDVREYLPEYERDEFTAVSPDRVAPLLAQFWSSHDHSPGLLAGSAAVADEQSSDEGGTAQPTDAGEDQDADRNEADECADRSRDVSESESDDDPAEQSGLSDFL